MSACFYCGAPCSLLCDGILGYLQGGVKPVTCDRPLCRACVKEHVVIHLKRKPRHSWDSLDYCPDCVAEGKQSGSRIFQGRQRPIPTFTPESAAAAQAARLLKPKTTEAP